MENEKESNLNRGDELLMEDYKKRRKEEKKKVIRQVGYLWWGMAVYLLINFFGATHWVVELFYLGGAGGIVYYLISKHYKKY